MDYNYEYCDLLNTNIAYHAKVRANKASYSSTDYKDLQSRLLRIELDMSAVEIVRHAAYCFPTVGGLA